MGRPLARMVNIAEKLLPSFGLVANVNPCIGNEEWVALGISPSKAEEVKMQVDEGLEEAIQFAGSFN